MLTAPKEGSALNSSQDSLVTDILITLIWFQLQFDRGMKLVKKTLISQTLTSQLLPALIN